ncbi:MAG: CpcT/CpeT family chromophore lyase [Steroidobacteraceae bacterium]|jgi:hypothetical protein|nr:CpcT/CpeT family chromophore lyase [Steroidobacteraceae bacterium]
MPIHDATGRRRAQARAFPMMLVLACAVAGCAAGRGAADAAPPLETELREILALLPGRYEGPAPGGRLYHKIVPIVAPQFGGDTVFYHQISRDGFDSTVPFQQKVYVFDRARDRAFNRMRSYVFFPKQGYANLEQDPAALNALQPGMLMNFPIECAIRWERGAAPGQYRARVRREQCSYDSAAFRQRISPELTYELARDAFAIEDILYGEDGRPLFPGAGLLRAPRVSR